MRHTDRIFVIGAAGFAGATLLFAVTLVRALTVEPSPPVPADDLVASPPPVEPVTDDAPRAAAAGPEVEAKQPLVRESEPVVAERPLTMDALQLAIDNDPFQESRRRPPERYRMPGDPIEDAGPPPPPPPPPFQVLGIAQLPGGGGSAIMQVEDAPPRVVSVGESLFGYTLDRVEGEVATLSGQGRTLTLTVAQASPNPAAEEEARGRRQGRARNAEEAIERLRNRRNAESETVERVREAQQGAIEAIRRMMELQQQRRNNGGGEATWQGFFPLSTQPANAVRGRIIFRADTSRSPLPRR